MVELRWIPLESGSQLPRASIPGYPENGPDHFKLQYRVLGPKSYTIDHNGHVNGITQEWKEWQDVPVDWKA